MNTVILTGRLGRDPEISQTRNGKTQAKFSLAVDDGWGENKRTFWFPIVVFGKTAEFAGKYLHKGSKVLISGKVESREYEKDGERRKYFGIVAFQVEFSDSKPKGGVTDGEQKPRSGHVSTENIVTPDDPSVPF